MSAVLLRPDQAERYRRHLTLPEIGLDGQQKLLGAHILLIGVGGLGCPVAQYLAAAGVGRLGLVDPDRVDASNLQRQVLYGTADLGRLKVEVARDRIAAMNPDVRVDVFDTKLTSENALELLRGWDILIDGSETSPPDISQTMPAFSLRSRTCTDRCIDSKARRRSLMRNAVPATAACFRNRHAPGRCLRAPKRVCWASSLA